MSAATKPLGLAIRKLADKTDGERVSVWHPITGEKVLMRPENVGDRLNAVLANGDPAAVRLEADPWPLAGVRLETPHPLVVANPYFIRRGEAEGWLTAYGESYVHRPGGPAGNPWGTTHTFRHLERVVLETIHGPVPYRVIHQPDKYHDGPAGTDAAGDTTARVEWTYVLEREAELPLIAGGANFIFNRAKGRYVEWAERINANDPTNAALIIDVLATSGIEADATLLDKDDFAAVVAGTTNFVTQSSIRKTLDQAGGITIQYDDTGDLVDVDIPDQTWTAVGAGDGWNDVLIGYDSDTTAGTDANILTASLHDFVLTPDGSDITAQINVEGIWRAT